MLSKKKSLDEIVRYLRRVYHKYGTEWFHPGQIQYQFGLYVIDSNGQAYHSDISNHSRNDPIWKAVHDTFGYTHKWTNTDDDVLNIISSFANSYNFEYSDPTTFAHQELCRTFLMSKPKSLFKSNTYVCECLIPKTVKIEKVIVVPLFMYPILIEYGSQIEMLYNKQLEYSPTYSRNNKKGCWTREDIHEYLYVKKLTIHERYQELEQMIAKKKMVVLCQESKVTKRGITVTYYEITDPAVRGQIEAEFYRGNSSKAKLFAKEERDRIDRKLNPDKYLRETLLNSITKKPVSESVSDDEDSVSYDDTYDKIYDAV